jgi:hypothetical protein
MAEEHALATFLAQDLAEMASEYARIYRRSAEDPGTAGDEGEETWASVLRAWLPAAYQVRVKGRILGANGAASPQVDVVVLRPGYPERLLDKKLYLAGGVAAVFECKNTLTAEHIAKTWANVAAVNALESWPRRSTPREALAPNIYYGLLAHGCSWDKPNSDPDGVITAKLQSLLDETPMMRDTLGLLCVANLASWSVFKMAYNGPALMGASWEARREKLGLTSDEPICELGYLVASQTWETYVPSNPLGVLVAKVVSRLAFTDRTLVPLSEYFAAAGMSGLGSSSAFRTYSIDSQYPEEMLGALPDALVNGRGGGDWSIGFNF